MQLLQILTLLDFGVLLSIMQSQQLFLYLKQNPQLFHLESAAWTCFLVFLILH